MAVRIVDPDRGVGLRVAARPGYAEWVGTREDLVAEGVLSAGFRWPKNQSWHVWWTDDRGIKCYLRRERPSVPRGTPPDRSGWHLRFVQWSELPVTDPRSEFPVAHPWPQRPVRDWAREDWRRAKGVLLALEQAFAAARDDKFQVALAGIVAGAAPWRRDRGFQRFLQRALGTDRDDRGG